MPTTASAKALNSTFPNTDSSIVRALRAAGAIVVAKANLNTFALYPGSEVTDAAKNPYGLEVATPGGSSSGNGAGAAAVFGVLGVGTDTGGSVMMPSAYSNTVGFNMQFGRIPMDGVVPLFSMADRAGPMARYAEDVARMLDALDPTAPFKPFYASPAVLNESGLENMQIGYLKTTLQAASLRNGSATWNPTPEMRVLFDRALFNLVGSGAIVKPISNFTHAQLLELVDTRVLHERMYFLTCLSRDMDHYLLGVTNTSPYRSSRQLVDSGLLRPDMAVALSISMNQSHLCDDVRRGYLTAQQQLTRQYIDPLFSSASVDLVLSLMDDAFPYTANMKPQLLSPLWLGVFSGYPQMSLPLGFSAPSPGAPQGLPIGLYAMARPGHERLLLQMAYAYQKRFGPGPVLPASVPSQQDSSGQTKQNHFIAIMVSVVGIFSST